MDEKYHLKKYMINNQIDINDDEIKFNKKNIKLIDITNNKKINSF